MIKVSYVLAVVFGFATAFFYASDKDFHFMGVISLIISVVFCLSFVVNMLKEVYSSTRIELHEKIMWTVGGLFAMSVVGLVYLLLGRKRVLDIH